MEKDDRGSRGGHTYDSEESAEGESVELSNLRQKGSRINVFDVAQVADDEA